MNSSKNILCRDINGNVHIVSKAELVQRTSVYGIVRDENGTLLVRDRTSDEKWDLPGGGINPGEEIITALRREINEETKLTIADALEKVCEFTEYFYDIDTQKGWESTRHFYKVAHEGNPQLDGNGDDIVEGRYFNEPFSVNEVSAATREVMALSTHS